MIYKLFITIFEYLSHLINKRNSEKFG